MHQHIPNLFFETANFRTLLIFGNAKWHSPVRLTIFDRLYRTQMKDQKLCFIPVVFMHNLVSANQPSHAFVLNMIPPETVARVFQEVAFRRPETRISAKGVALSTEYIRLFVEEALLRANEHRKAEAPPTRIDGIDNVEETGGDEAFNTSMDEENEERGLGVPTQVPEDYTSDTLDTRQLMAITGLLVLDF